MIRNELINSSLEVGFRTLIILDSIFPEAIDIDTLIIYDYLILHTEDAGEGPKSLHPSTPHRSSELLVRRHLIQEGIELMESRELIQRDYSGYGISFKANQLTRPFINYFETNYSKELKLNAKWVKDFFYHLDYKDLKEYVKQNLDSWGGEFSYESVLRRDDI